MSRVAVILALVVIAVAAPQRVASHGGGLDGYGCHHDRKAGGYHCHRGPVAGRAFSSKDEAQGAMEPGLLPYSAGSKARPPAAKAGSAAKGASVEDRLRRLDDLHRKGLLTDEEVAAKRKEILGDL